MGVCWPRRLSSVSTWMQSSRVGTRMMAWVARPRTHFWRMGMPKAAVLRVPVRAWPRMSTFSSARGMRRDWISEGVSNLASARPRRMEGRTPSAAKAWGWGCAWVWVCGASGWWWSWAWSFMLSGGGFYRCKVGLGTLGAERGKEAYEMDGLDRKSGG